MSGRRKECPGLPHQGILAALWAGLSLTLLFVWPVNAEEGRDRVWLSGSFAEERFLAGREVRVESATLSDLFAAGGEVEIDGTTAQDVIAAGGSIRITDSSVADLVMAGGEIEIAAEVGDDLIAAGGRVQQRANSAVKGYAILAGGDVEIAGRIEGNLTAAAGRIRISGEIQGDANIAAGRIRLDPGARILGKLTYRSDEEADIAADAVVQGGVERLEAEDITLPLPALIGVGIGVLIVVLLGMGILGAALHVAVPEILAGAVVTLSARPWPSLGLGFALLVATPVAANLLFVTLIGALLGLFLLVLYCLALTMATFTAAYWLGSRLAGVFGWSYGGEPIAWRILWTFVGVIGLAILAVVPFVGWVLLIVAVAAGLGAFALRAGRLLHDWGRRPHGAAAF